MRTFRALLSSLVLLALLLGGAVPAGFMPGKRDGGVLKIEICTASGWSTVEIPADGHGKDGRAGDGRAGDGHAPKTCPHASVLAHALVPSAQLALFAPPSSFIRLGAAQPHRPAAAKHWHAQGPPLLS